MPQKKGHSTKLGPGCSIRQKRHRYYARFYDPARRPTEKMIALVAVDGTSTLATTDRTLALSLARSLYAEYVRGAFDPWHRAATVAEAVVGVTITDALQRYLEENAGRLRQSNSKEGSHPELYSVLLAEFC